MSLEVSPTKGINYLYKNANEKLHDKAKTPLVMSILVAVVLVYVLLFKYLGIAHNNTLVKTEHQSRILMLLLWGIFVFLIMVNGLQYFFGINLSVKLSDYLSGEPKMNINVQPGELVNEVDLNRNEVFHIGENVYDYEEAKILCKAYDAELASYDQIEKAYNNGAEWCSYGWSKGQMALYPTQKSTYQELQKYPGNENNCGRPGINGGYIKNPKAKFGVNCYGTKGSPSDKERQMMKQGRIIPSLPVTKENKKLDFYRRNINKIVKKPFNNDKWSVL